MNLETAFRSQAEACAHLGSPMYGVLLDRVADALAAGGGEAEPLARVLAGHEDDPGLSALALRFAGSVHRLVLERRAGALAAFYPSVGGAFEPDGAWTALRALVEAEPDAVREWLDRPPQTNEVGRSAALVAGLLEVTRATGLPVRLVEIGASGGLNLLADRFSFVDDHGRVHGDPSSPVRVDDAWSGDGPWADPEVRWPRVVERIGSDLMPIDVATTAGRLALTAYVWPDMQGRHERLRGALRLAAQHPVTVERRGALETVERLELVEGTVTVLWHSVMWQYVDRTEQDAVRARIDELGATATATAGLAHVTLEPSRRTPAEERRFWLTVRRWPDGADGLHVGAGPHGPPVEWLGDCRP